MDYNKLRREARELYNKTSYLSSVMQRTGNGTLVRKTFGAVRRFHETHR